MRTASQYALKKVENEYKYAQICKLSESTFVGIFMDFSKDNKSIKIPTNVDSDSIYYSSPGIFLDLALGFTAGKIGVGYPLVWCILKQIFTSVSVNNGSI